MCTDCTGWTVNILFSISSLVSYFSGVEYRGKSLLTLSISWRVIILIQKLGTGLIDVGGPRALPYY